MLLSDGMGSVASGGIVTLVAVDSAELVDGGGSPPPGNDVDVLAVVCVVTCTELVLVEVGPESPPEVHPARRSVAVAAITPMIDTRRPTLHLPRNPG